MMDLASFAAGVGTAFLLGIIIGLERELRNHEAGLRTNALLALGAALFVSISRFVDHEGSPTRITGQVVSGIGFLAGGVIIRDGFAVRGLNTAATLWCTAAIGALAGSGFLLAATLGTVLVLLLHVLMRPFTLRIDSWAKTHARKEVEYRIRVTARKSSESAIRQTLMDKIKGRHATSLLSVQFQLTDQPDEGILTVHLQTTIVHDDWIEDTIAAISPQEGVLSTLWERIQTRTAA
jgi:putative Mg2+ transporter-C (MgtC) family protein